MPKKRFGYLSSGMIKMNRYFKTNPYGSDIKLFLILIPFINSINYYLTYSNIQFNWFLFLTFSIDVITGYIAWFAVRSFILYLDKKMPYDATAVKRIVFQLISTAIIGLGIISVLTEIISYIAKNKPAPLHFYTKDLFIIGIWIFVINGMYIGLYYYNRWRVSEDRLRKEQSIKAEGINVKIGNKNIKIFLKDIRGAYVEDGCTFIIDLQYKTYLIDGSLEILETKLPKQLYFRINRKFIVHRDEITSYKRAAHNKLEITTSFSPPLPTGLTISRLKAPAFKKWFDADMISVK